MGHWKVGMSIFVAGAIFDEVAVGVSLFVAGSGDWRELELKKTNQKGRVTESKMRNRQHVWSLRHTENPVWAGPAAHWLVAMHTFYEYIWIFFLWNFRPACLGGTCRIIFEGHDSQQPEKHVGQGPRATAKENADGVAAAAKGYVLFLFIPIFL